jgi:hypothetical protein
LLCWAQVESQGRRPLLLLGVGGMVAALLLLGTSQDPSLAGWWHELGEGLVGSLGGAADPAVPLAAWAGAAALLLYVGCYQVRASVRPLPP